MDRTQGTLACSNAGSGMSNRGLATVGIEHSPITLSEHAKEGMRIIMPVTEDALDPLLHSSIITPPVVVAPSAIETPTDESYTHVSTPPSVF
jgi:hypothetical protein